jgi:signal recognition particle subunit SRP54
MKQFDDEKERQQEECHRNYTMEDFGKQLLQIGRLGPLKKVMDLIPGMGTLNEMMGDVDPEEEIQPLIGIIDAMTPEERCNPAKFVDQGRRRRIAAGAGVQPNEVKDLVSQFDSMSRTMNILAHQGIRERRNKGD